MSTAKFTLEIMVPEFCRDDNSILKGALRSNASYNNDLSRLLRKTDF